MVCRYAKAGLMPNRQPADDELSNLKVEMPSQRLERALTLKEKFAKNVILKNVLLISALLGVSLTICNGIFTPCISMMAAVSGLKVAIPSLSQDSLVAITIVLLILLFGLQQFGIGKVRRFFAPVLCIWFVSIASIGIWNIIKYDPSIFRAFNPLYVYYFFSQNKKRAWYILGGLVLCITGGEAMFADLGNYRLKSLKIAFAVVVYPCLLLSYMGQAAYLVKNPLDVSDAFYNSIPGIMYWPVFVFSMFAVTIASRSMILVSFSVIRAAVALDCFPRVKIIHTSKQVQGQIYIPAICFLLMVMCVAVTAGFRSTYVMGHAYGVVVLGEMFITTGFIILVMVMIWQISLILVFAFAIIIGGLELLYFFAVLMKVQRGGWVPLVIALALVCVMYIWHYGTRVTYQSEVEQRISMDYMLELGANLGTVRVEGVGLLYNDLAHGVPAIFGYFIKSLPATHSTIVFVCIKHVHVPRVPMSQRFVFRRVCPRDYHLFRCIARYGYKDVRAEDHTIFEKLLLRSLEIFIQKEAQEYALEFESFGMETNINNIEPPSQHRNVWATSGSLTEPLLSSAAPQSDTTVGYEDDVIEGIHSEHEIFTPRASYSYILDNIALMELSAIRNARESGVAYLLGHADVRAKKESWFFKKLIINYFYSFLARNCRGTTETLSVPHTHLLQVGMTYMV
ncbi:hypothetical protein KP509_18G056200 [Ceratopteris richardii]|nr:hypothetical protein KP509_18G056200 [Ceratopteris richardii]KAH7365958.1 hypothetical protein KP509_18G056200 [Ceratopteris richardii]